MPKNILLTGGSGFIGYNVANQLLNRSYKVKLLTRRKNFNIEKLEERGAHVVVCDLLRPETYHQELQDIDGIFHLAAENTTSTAEKDKVIANTSGLLKNFFQAAIEARVPVIIYTSSVVVLGRSRNKNRLITEKDKTDFCESPYVEGKILAENHVRSLVKKGYDIRTVYPSWVLGEGADRMPPPQKIIRNFVLKGQLFYFDGGISIADVKEVAKAHIRAFEKGYRGGSYVLAGENLTFKEFYDTLAENCGGAKPKIKLPKSLVVAASYVTKSILSLLGIPPLLEPAYAKSVFGKYSWYDSRKAERELGYKITPANDLLKRAVIETRHRLYGTTELGRVKPDRPKCDANVSGQPLLITGVPGWLGNRMVDIMINGDKTGEFRTNRPITLLVEPRFKGMLKLPTNFNIIHGDLLDKNSLQQAVAGVSTVFHLAGVIAPPKIASLYRVNLEGTKNLIDACIEKGVRRVIYMSTDSVCGRGTKEKRVFDEYNLPMPYRDYGKSKYLAEKYVLDKTDEGLIDGTSMRGFWFFGPFASPKQTDWLNMFNWERQIIFGHGNNYRSITHVDNLVQAFLKAEVNKKTFGKWYWICGNEHTMTTNQIYQQICLALEKEFNPIHIPTFMCVIANWADNFLRLFGNLHPIIHPAGKSYFDIAGKIDAAKRDFNYKPKISMQAAAEELKNM